MAKKLISFDDAEAGDAALPEVVNTVLRNTYGRVPPQALPAFLPAHISLAARDAAPRYVVFMGSSTIEGSNATPRTQRFTNRLEKMLQASYNPTGIPGGYEIRAVDPSPVVQTTGTVTTESVGLGLRSRGLAAGATLTHASEVCTGFTVRFLPGSGRGSFTVAIDGGTPVTVDAKSLASSEWSSPALERGEHTIVVTAVETCVISHLYMHDGDQNVGVRVVNAGLGGASAVSFTSGHASHWTELGRIASRVASVAIMTGSNEADGQISLSSFRGNVLALIQKVEDSLGHRPWISLLGMPNRPDSSYAIPEQAYRDVLAQIAAENPTYVTYHDLAPQFPKTQAADVYNLMDTDSIHQTTLGHAYTADVLAELWKLPSRAVSGAQPPAVGSGGTSFDLAKDSFDRVDATSLGVAESGQTWQAIGDWRIASNQAHSMGGGHAWVPISSAAFDAKVDAIFATAAVAMGINFYISDASNRITFYLNNNQAILQKNDAGAQTTLSPNHDITLVNGTSYELRVVVDTEGVITAYIDGVQTHTYTMDAGEKTKFFASKNVGLRHGNSLGRFDNFLVV